VSELRKGPTRTRADYAFHQKKLIVPSCDIGFQSFLAKSKCERASQVMAQKSLDFEIKGERNS
jgi:hypothetical protein